MHSLHINGATPRSNTPKEVLLIAELAEIMKVARSEKPQQAQQAQQAQQDQSMGMKLNHQIPD